jgi:hypothetical protein
MATGFAVAWQFAKRFWPLFVIVPLAFVILIQRTTISDKTAKLDLKTAEAAQLSEANKANTATIRAFAQQRIDNDAIAEAVAARLDRNGVREVNTRTIIERAKQDDPQVRDWANQPVPNSVRRAIARPN